MKETELFKPIKEYLLEAGYTDVYSEVQAGRNRADVVATSGSAVCVVELKTSLTMELIEQAILWREKAHYIFIAIPKRKKPIPSFVKRVLRDNKIGILEVGNSFLYSNQVFATQKARFNRPYFEKFSWNNILREEHKTWAEGGTAGGGYFTPYKLTIENVKHFLYLHRGWHTVDAILEHCETHYSNPKPSLAQALIAFESEWCEMQIIKRKRHYKIKDGVTLRRKRSAN